MKETRAGRNVLITYDLPSENREGLTRKQRTALNTQRSKIRMHLRGDLKAEKVQASLWYVRGVELKQLRRILNSWIEEYEDLGIENLNPKIIF